MSSLNLRIENMHCGSCVRRVTQTLSSIPGVQVDDVQVGTARIQLTDSAVSPAAIIAAIVKAGFPAQVEL